jgi:HK97 family phage portal protein
VGARGRGGDWQDQIARALLDTSPTAAGRAVTEESALSSVAVYACVRVIAETVATLPLLVYRRLGRGRERAPDHPLYPLLHDQANPEQTAVEFRENLLGHALLWGNGYAEIERGPGGSIRALWPLRPDRMAVERDRADRLVYTYELPDGGRVPFPFASVLHLRGFGGGLTGLSPVAMAREAIGLSLAVEEYGARFFGNDSRPGGVLQYPGTLSDEALTRLKSSWEQGMRGLAHRHRVAVLEGGVSWQQIGIPPQDAQFLDTRKFQLGEIARLFRVPPHLIGELDRATWGNIEHQAIDFVVHTIRPWLVRTEQALRRDLFGLLPARLRDDYHAEHLVDGLLRGDAMSRAQALATQRQNGVITANEWREIENRNPIAGGDELLVNGTMVPVDQAGRAADGAGGAAAGPSFVEQVNAVGTLIRSGFEADASAAAAGLPPIAHTGLLPVTLQSAEKAEAGAPPPAGNDATEGAA